jgi:Uma2 family endonuclease
MQSVQTVPSQTVPVPPVDHPVPPNADDLPYSDGMPMESARHVAQMYLLGLPLKLHWHERQDAFVGMNMFVYFSADQRFNEAFRGPDVFVAMGVRPGERLRWVVWEELKGPDLVIELLSESTRSVDMAEKKLVYQDFLRVPEYVWYDPFTGERAGWALRDGRYEAIEPDAADRLPSRVLGLTLVRWHGVYMDIEATWLRWATADGGILPTEQEIAAEAQEQAAQAQAHAAQAQAQAAQAQAHAAQAQEQAALAQEQAALAQEQAAQADERAAQAQAEREEERRRAAQAEQRARQAEQRAAEMEARLAEMERRLREDRGPA